MTGIAFSFRSGIKILGKESDRIQDSSIFAVTERIELAAAVKIILGDRSVKGMKIFKLTLN